MKILYLTLKSKWYDMIERGEKKEEYREMTIYWIKRLRYENDGSPDRETGYAGMIINNEFTHVKFARGGHFASFIPQMTFEIKGFGVSTGNPDWGAEAGKKYFVIELGLKVNSNSSQLMNDLTASEIF